MTLHRHLKTSTLQTFERQNPWFQYKVIPIIIHFLMTDYIAWVFYQKELGKLGHMQKAKIIWNFYINHGS